MITDEELAHYQEVAEKATDGPWALGWIPFGSKPKFVSDTTGQYIASPTAECNVVGAIDYNEGGVLDKDDAEFIALSRTALPKLIEACKELKAIANELALFPPTESHEDISDCCFFCGAENEVEAGPRGGLKRVQKPHDSDCLWLRANQLIYSNQEHSSGNTN